MAIGQRVGQPSEVNVSARLVQATGTTTSRSLKDRFADTVNVKDFGAKGDGVTDDTAAIQAALNAAEPGRGTVLVPDPQPNQFYNTTAPIRWPSGVNIRGSFRIFHAGAPSPWATGYQLEDHPSIKKTTNTTVAITPYEGGAAVARDCVFYVDKDPVSNIFGQSTKITGLAIVGAGSSLVEYGIYAEAAGGIVIEDVDVAHTKYSFYGRNIWTSRFVNSRFFGRFYVDRGTSLSIINSASGSSQDGFGGWHLRNVIYSSMVSATSDHAHDSAYTFFGTSLTMVGCGCENALSPNANDGTVLQLQGWNRITAINLFGYSTSMASTKPMVSINANDELTLIGGDFSLNAAQTVDIYSQTAGGKVQSIRHRWLNGSTSYPVQQPALAGYSTVDSDLYRTGTWTPAVGFISGSTVGSDGVTYASRSGSYTRQGNLVIVTADITLTSKGTSTGTLVVTGLPIPAGTYPGAAQVMISTGIGVPIKGKVEAATNRIRFYGASSAAGSVVLNTDVTDTAHIEFQAIYQLTGVWVERNGPTP